MSDSSPQKIIAGLILLAQSIPIASNSYGGLSGFDSIGRSMCTLVDPSVSILLFYGLFNLSFFTKSKRIRLARMDMIHTTRLMDAAPLYQSTVVSYRASWSDIGNLTSRSGEFKLGWSNGGLVDPRNIEAVGLSGTTVAFAPNSNHWIYPYMLGRQPQREATTAADHETVQEVTLTRRGLIRTTALAVARFAIFLASSILITLFHIIIAGLLFEDKLVKTIMILADIGRWMLVVGQVASIMTYSLDYKGVCSWASPKEFQEDAIYGTTWSPDEQKFCREQVLHYIGKAYHGRLVFSVCASLWSKVASRVPERWDPDCLFAGTTIFSMFKCLDEKYFHEEQMTLLHLHVKCRAPGDANNGWDGPGSYIVDFKVPTAMIQLFFENSLVAGSTQRKWNFIVMAPFCFCSVVSPFLVVWRDGGPSTTAMIVIGLIQIIVLAFTYKDIDDWSINCKFESANEGGDQLEVDNTSGRRNVHEYPPNSAASTSGSDQGRVLPSKQALPLPRGGCIP
ncbi:hypothetical protein D9758_009282 [Tetrapyrgos nigripes]|uniref:Uncharacterized protein n=1 Tax=Tetrapyrgos nigripes TaxID=182062 RepID=A0A8H5GH90_9AGAR|nr:hypothetical protein D9758_009282 [Tetrapyrgos nigripes]